MAWLNTGDPMQEDREWQRVGMPWPAGRPEAVDAFGSTRETIWDEAAQTVSVELTATPVFIAAA